jgi:hypothetical protein
MSSNDTSSSGEPVQLICPPNALQWLVPVACPFECCQLFSFQVLYPLQVTSSPGAFVHMSAQSIHGIIELTVRGYVAGRDGVVFEDTLRNSNSDDFEADTRKLTAAAEKKCRKICAEPMGDRPSTPPPF